MLLLKKRGLLIFWCILLLDCYFIISGNDSSRWVSKGLLIPILGSYVFLNAKKNFHQTTKLFVFFSLLCAWLGDLLLLKEGEFYFMAGMGFFMCFHLLIAITFFRFQKLKLAKCQNAVIATGVYVFLCYRLFKFLHDGIVDYKAALIVYAACMGLMVIAVFNQLESGIRKLNAVNFFIPAAILFVISDATLALQKFKFFNENYLSIIVMLAYGYSMSLFSDGFSKILKGA
ncbi:MAG: lysoplasmalogenase [Sphingobacteriia bacterium]|nr:lysoplasmalogenase [Sphingobacteriia bacterium]